jgi:hypothetical protein
VVSTPEIVAVVTTTGAVGEIDAADGTAATAELAAGVIASAVPLG